MAIGPQVFNTLSAARQSRLNLSAATVVKASRGFVATVTVVTAGSTAGRVHDTLTTGAAATANCIAAVPNTVGTYIVNFPAQTGIVVVPGTGQTLAISFA